MKKASKKTAKRGGPSAASLREMPERAPGAKWVRNPFAAKIAEAGGIELHVGDQVTWIPSRQVGRPKKDAPGEPSEPRSLRLPTRIWTELEQRAKADGVAVNSLLRGLVAEYLAAAGPAKVRTRTRATKARRGRDSA